MLVGGPIGITFIAIAAVPAIIVGLPVWVGRKVIFSFPWIAQSLIPILITGLIEHPSSKRLNSKIVQY